ncbi:Oligosaccharide translocation protein rft1, partial [Nowakowskiella sp. JEL0078]
MYSPDSYSSSLYLFLLASCIDLLSEPFYSIAQNLLLFSIRVKIEGLALIVKTVTTAGLISIFYARSLGDKVAEDDALFSFGIAQINYSMVLLIGYALYFMNSECDVTLREFFPRKYTIEIHENLKSQYFSQSRLSLVASFTVQSFVKHVLTYADQLVLGTFASHEDQGVTIGSLIVRIIFQPIEESTRIFFSKAFSEIPTQATLKDTQKLLSYLIRFQIILAKVLLSFTPFYSTSLIKILYSNDWALTTAPRLLPLYSLSLPVMGINGITEGFVQSVSTPEIVRLQTMVLGVGWILFITVFVSGWALGMSIFAVVFANIVNMGVRIAFAEWVMRKWYGKSIVWSTGVETIWELSSIGSVIAATVCSTSLWFFGIEKLGKMSLHIAVGGV